MTDPTPTRRWFRWSLLIAISLALTAMAYLTVTGMLAAREQRFIVAAKERVRGQIERIRSGEPPKKITLGNELHDFQLEMNCFVQTQGELTANDEYELVVWYSHDVDKFLENISGLHGARSVLLYKTDVSDAGIESVAQMPDLERIRLGGSPRYGVTGAGVARIREKFPHLEITIHPAE